MIAGTNENRIAIVGQGIKSRKQTDEGAAAAKGVVHDAYVVRQGGEFLSRPGGHHERGNAALNRAEQMMRTRGNKQGAFTLIEILAVVVILGILAAVVVPRVLASSATAKVNACYQNKATINTAVERWYFEKGTWPVAAMTGIKADVNYFPDGIPACPVDATAYALDATSNRVSGHTH